MVDDRFDIADPLAARLRAWFAEGAPRLDSAELALKATTRGSPHRAPSQALVGSAVAAVILVAVAFGLGLSALWDRQPSIGTDSPTPSPAATIERPLLLGDTIPGGGDEIFLADWDGDIGENLTNHPANEHSGELSPDGQKMVFVSDRAGSLDVYVMDLATRGVTRLTDDTADDWKTRWSPDGSRIALFRVGPGMEPTIFLIAADGSDETAVTDGSAPANHVEWSSDGEWLLVWMVSEDSDFDVFLMRPDGSDLQQITDTPGDEGPGTFSPDGSLIAFSYAEPGGQRDIWVMRTDGTERRQLTDDSDEDWTTEPVWSPDGQQILYQRGVRGSYYVVGLDGGDPEKLFEGPPGGAP